MFKRFRVIFLFFLILLGPLGLFVQWNNQTPVLKQGDLVVQEVKERLYALQLHFDGKQCSIELEVAPGTGPLTLVLDNAGPLLLSVNGKTTKMAALHDPYQRLRFIPLQPLEGQVSITISPLQDDPKAMTSVQPYSPPGTLLASQEVALSASHLSFGITMFYCGLYCLIIVNCLILFQKKKEERYLVVLALASIISLIRIVLLSNYPLIPISNYWCSQIMPSIFLLTTISHILICFMLLKEAIPKQLSRYMTTKNIVLLILILLLLQAWLPEGIESGLRLLMLPVLLWLFVRADHHHVAGTKLLVVGYAFWQSVLIFYSMVYEQGGMMQAGEVMIIAMLPQLGFIVFMMMSTIVVNRKFASKFYESEQLNRQLELINKNLDQIVEQRTAQIQSQQLQKHRMIMNLLHDVRSPVFVLKGCAQQLHSTDTQQLELIATMRQRLEMLEGISEDLFLITKLENHELAFVFDDVDLVAVLKLVVAANQMVVNQKKGKLHLVGQLDQPMIIWADSLRLQRVFDNCIRNAFAVVDDYGMIELGLNITPSHFELRIKDTGPGISLEELPYIFDFFYSGNKLQRGSGLGLTIAKEIMEAHHGTIEVEATSSQGTTFLLCFPRL